MWLGWLERYRWGGLCCLLLYSSRERKILEPCRPGGGRGSCRAALAAAAETVVDEGQEGQLFLPILEAVLELGAGIGLLAWLQSRWFVRVREAVGTCIGGGRGRAFVVMWGSASILKSKSSSSPQDACGILELAPYWPIWAGRAGVGDHGTGIELSGSEGPPGVGWLPDILLARLGCACISA